MFDHAFKIILANLSLKTAISAFVFTVQEEVRGINLSNLLPSSGFINYALLFHPQDARVGLDASLRWRMVKAL